MENTLKNHQIVVTKLSLEKFNRALMEKLRDRNLLKIEIDAIASQIESLESDLKKLME